MGLFDKINSFFSKDEETDELLKLFDDSEEIEEVKEDLEKMLMLDDEEDVEEGDLDE